MTWILGTKLGRWALIALGALVALSVVLRRSYRNGKRDAINEAIEIDRRRADAIRKRVDAVSVRPGDIRYRDD